MGSTRSWKHVIVALEGRHRIRGRFGEEVGFTWMHESKALAHPGGFFRTDVLKNLDGYGILVM